MSRKDMLDNPDLMKCLVAIEDSLTMRSGGDTRGFLNYLADFLAEIGMKVEEISPEEVENL